MNRARLGVLAAIAVTTLMDAIGLTAFSALPLLPLMLLLWRLEGFSRREMGLGGGRWPHLGLAVLYPLLVLGVLGLVTALAGAANLAQVRWDKAWLNVLIVAGSTVLVAILTEEGFFRGWLVASLARAGKGRSAILVWSSVAFSLWHVSAVTLTDEFRLPAAQIGVYLVNAALIGAVWGMLRLISGSVIVASVSHGLWNGGAYVLFGFGTRAGALGVTDTAIYGPEVGILGLALNGAFTAALWWWWQRRDSRPAAAAP